MTPLQRYGRLIKMIDTLEREERAFVRMFPGVHQEHFDHFSHEHEAYRNLGTALGELRACATRDLHADDSEARP